MKASDLPIFWPWNNNEISQISCCKVEVFKRVIFFEMLSIWSWSPGPKPQRGVLSCEQWSLWNKTQFRETWYSNFNNLVFWGCSMIMMGLTLKKPRPKQTGRLNQSLSAFAGSARQPGKWFLHILALINPDGWFVFGGFGLPLKLHRARDSAQMFHLD